MKTLEQAIQEFGSVEAVARFLDVSRQTVIRWRTRTSKPSRVMVRMAAEKGIELCPLLIP